MSSTNKEKEVKRGLIIGIGVTVGVVVLIWINYLLTGHLCDIYGSCT